jgi:hypothetical protein
MTLSYRTLTDTYRLPNQWTCLADGVQASIWTSTSQPSQPPQGTARSVASRGMLVDVIARHVATPTTTHHSHSPSPHGLLLRRLRRPRGSRSLALARLIVSRTPSGVGGEAAALAACPRESKPSIACEA